MKPFVSRRSLFAASILAVLGMAADPNDAGSDASTAADASLDAGAVLDATEPLSDASPTPDATLPAPDGASAPDSQDGSADAEGGTSEGVGFVQDDGGLPSYTGPDIFEFLCVEPPDVTPFSYAAVKAPYTTAAACKAFDSAVGHETARACLCDSCFALQQQCDALEGCQAIQKCSWDTGCHDSNSCYLVQGLCTTPINNAGTGSVSTALSTALETCGNSHMCPAQ
jgi:hypothetical protein